jgi:hypothetical protein
MSILEINWNISTLWKWDKHCHEAFPTLSFLSREREILLSQLTLEQVGPTL